MKGLYKTLPPFSPDYSGVCSTLFELGGLVVVLDGGGCTGNFTGYDEPRWYGSTSAVFSSGLREIDAVVGDDEKLLRKFEDAIHFMKRQFIAIIGSPAPMVIGTDYAALARLLSKKINLPVLTFDTNGMDYYDTGVSMALLEIARCFVKPGSSRIASGINIIGATPLDIGNSQQIKKLTSLLTGAGCHIVSCWAMGSTLDDIARSAQARLNIVISRAGLEAARYMEREYGVPYLAGIPIGRGPTADFINTVCSLLGTPNIPAPSKNVGRHPADKCKRSALVIGEQIMSNAVRDCLRKDMGVTEVAVASFFQMEQDLMEEDDVFLTGEDTLVDLTDRRRFDMIIGDPLYRDLVALPGNGRYIFFPHIALSSRLYWDNDVDYMGEEGLHYFQEKLGSVAT